MKETALDRFLKIRSYNDVEEIITWLNDEAVRLNNSVPELYNDMLALSMLSDMYFENVPQNIHEEIMKRSNGELPVLIGAFDAYRLAESRMVSMAQWSDIMYEIPEAERVRKYVYSLIEEYHAKGWDVQMSAVFMEEGEPDEYAIFSADIEGEEAVDEFEADILSMLCTVFDEFGEEISIQMFFNKPGQPVEKGFILVNCLWSETPDGYTECRMGPFIVSGKGKGNIELIAPDNIGLQVLSKNTA